MYSEHPLDSLFRKRFLAFVMDVFVILIIHYLVFLAFKGFVQKELFYLPPSFSRSLVYTYSWWSLSFFVTGSYFSFCFFHNHGQTMGMKIYKLKLQGKGQELTLKQSLRRTWGEMLFFYSGGLLYLTYLWSKDGQGLQEKISSTCLTEIDRPFKVDEFKKAA